MASRKSTSGEQGRSRPPAAPVPRAEAVTRERPPWELRRLRGLLRARAVSLRPDQYLRKRVGDKGVVEAMAVSEPTWAWWDDRWKRVRHYLRRAVTGRIPRDVFGWEGDDLPQVARERMARLAILLAAIVLRESPPPPLERSIRRRLNVLADAVGLPVSTRSIAADVSSGRLQAADAGRSGALEMDLVEDAGLSWVRTGLGSARAWRRVRRSESRRPWRRLSVLFWRLASRGSLLIVASVMNSSSSSRGIATGSTTGRCFVTRH